MSANNSGDDSEGTNVSQQSYEMCNNGDTNYSELDDVNTDDVNTESDTKSAHSSYSAATYSDDVVINRIDNNVIVNEKHLIDHNIDDNSIRKPRPFRKTCCKFDPGITLFFLSFHIFIKSFAFFPFHLLCHTLKFEKKRKGKKANNFFQ